MDRDDSKNKVFQQTVHCLDCGQDWAVFFGRNANSVVCPYCRSVIPIIKQANFFALLYERGDLFTANKVIH